jgi:hypothetical protein
MYISGLKKTVFLALLHYLDVLLHCIAVCQSGCALDPRRLKNQGGSGIAGLASPVYVGCGDARFCQARLGF